MRQVQITTEVGVAILLAIFIFVLIIIALQQNKLDKSLREINTSVQTTRQAVDDIGSV